MCFSTVTFIKPENCCQHTLSFSLKTRDRNYRSFSGNFCLTLPEFPNLNVSQRLIGFTTCFSQSECVLLQTGNIWRKMLKMFYKWLVNVDPVSFGLQSSDRITPVILYFFSLFFACGGGRIRLVQRFVLTQIYIERKKKEPNYPKENGFSTMNTVFFLPQTNSLICTSTYGQFVYV